MGKGLPRSHSRGDPTQAPIVRRTYTAKDLSITMTAASGVGWGTAVLGDLPDGNVVLLGAAGYFIMAGSGADADLGDTWEGDYAIGMAPSTSNIALATDKADVVQSTAVAAATAEVSPRTRGVHLDADIGEMHDNTDGSLELNFNLLIDDANIAGDDSIILVNGTLHLAFLVLGDD